jgi:hypothetical protein
MALFQQLRRLVVEDEDRFGGKPVLVRIGGAALRARMVRAGDEAEGIDREEARSSASS